MPRIRTIAAVVVVALGLGWLYQDEILLAGIGFAAQRRMPVGPNQPVVWERGPDPASRAPGDEFIYWPN